MSDANGRSQKREKIFVALPHRPGDTMAMGLWQALRVMGEGEDFDIVGPRAIPCSMLPLSFNMLWCEALNARKDGVTKFCMVHSDVVPMESGWLAKLFREQHRTKADVLSCVIALKDDRGQSSTGVMNVDTREMRKLTLKECHDLVGGMEHKTFGVDDMGLPGQCLLMNTGCWICDFTQPWVEKMCFRFHDHLVKQTDGMWKAACVGEDWLFSIDAWRLELKCRATLEIPISHQGTFAYPNMTPWGTGEKDVSLAWNIEPPASWNWIEAPVKENELLEVA